MLLAWIPFSACATAGACGGGIAVALGNPACCFLGRWGSMELLCTLLCIIDGSRKFTRAWSSSLTFELDRYVRVHQAHLWQSHRQSQCNVQISYEQNRRLCGLTSGVGRDWP